jgi:hypothetical protein
MLLFLPWQCFLLLLFGMGVVQKQQLLLLLLGALGRGPVRKQRMLLLLLRLFGR